MYARVGLVLAGVSAAVGLALSSGPALADYDAYALDEPASFYGDDSPGLNYQYADEIGVMAQDDFPCQEDEVLGFGPQFGPDTVGCIHIDAITG